MPDKAPIHRGSLFYGALLLTAGSVAIQGVQLIFQIVISNVLGAAGLGRMHLILMIGSFAAILGSGGIRIAATCLAAEEAGRGYYSGVKAAMRCCFLYGICLSALVAAVLYRAAIPISIRWIGNKEAESSIRILAVFLPVGCASSVLAGFYTASGRIAELVSVELLERILSLGIVVLMLRISILDPCASVFFGSSLASLAGFLILFQRYRRSLRSIPSAPLRPMMSRLVHLTIPLGLNDVFRSGLRTVEHLLIPKGLRKSGASSEEAIASYGTIGGMVFPVITFPCIILNAVSDLLVPEMARCQVLKRQERIRFLTEKCLRFSTLFSVGFSGICLLLGDELGTFLFRSHEAGTYIRIFAPLIPILYVDTITDGMLKGLSQQLYTVRYNTITSLLDLFLIWLLVPSLGITGFLTAYTVSHILNFYLSLQRLVSITGYMPKLMTAVLSVTSCGMSVLLTMSLTPGLHGIVLFISVIPFLGLYLLFSGFFGILEGTDIQWIAGLIYPKKNTRSN